VLTRNSDYLKRRAGLRERLVGAAVCGGANLSQATWLQPQDLTTIENNVRGVLSRLHSDLSSRDLNALWRDRFDHWSNPSGSVLTCTDSLGEEHADLKVTLMREICDSLAARSDPELAPVAGALLDALTRSPAYLQNHTPLKSRLVAAVILRPCATAQKIDMLRGRRNVLHAAAADAFAAVHGMAIYQMLYVLENPPATDEETELAKTLRAAYDQRLPPALKRSLESTRHDDVDPSHFALLAPDGKSSLFLRHEYFRNWVMDVDSGASAPPAGPCTLYAWHADKPMLTKAGAVDFALSPITNAFYQSETNGQLMQLIDALKLQPEYRKIFMELMNLDRTQDSALKLVASYHVEPLAQAFGKVMEPRARADGTATQRITDAHLERLAEIYDVSGAALAPRLLWLAAVFTRYSNTELLGTETESPPAVRQYAAALLESARLLDEKLAGQFPLNKWITELQALGTAGCTLAVYDEMLETLRARLGEFYRLVVPAAWR
jgi:hypothetical protein